MRGSPSSQKASGMGRGSAARVDQRRTRNAVRVVARWGRLSASTRGGPEEDQKKHH